MWRNITARGSAQQRTPTANGPAATVAYAGSATCRGCHSAAYDHWSASHHALAERTVDFVGDRSSFRPDNPILHASQVSSVAQTNGQLFLNTLGPRGARESFRLERVLGVDPLRQYLIPFAGGRWQVTELATDSKNGDWFDIFGHEDRKPGEWGHWTGRGMNWNSMCASCHNTGVDKAYVADTDSYQTRLVEAGVGCESCHGPLGEHVAWQRGRPQPATGDPTVHRITKEQLFEACGPCHARRSDLTGRFVAGDKLLDHHVPVIPDETDVFHPDGQIRDEDYEWAPFLSSRMHAAGVRCWDCHDAHSGKTKSQGNVLCLRCHAAGSEVQAPRVDPSKHSFHRVGGEGDQCVACHMPQTVYMQRHARRDHGFTVPDPLLTREHGIPNACDRCHRDKGLPWQIEWAERWYGARMNRPTRERARLWAIARSGARSAVPALVVQSRTNAIPLWRASATSLLRRWAHEPPVTAALLAGLRDPDPLVRVMAVRSLDGLGPQLPEPLTRALDPLLDDPVRAVRVEAAWADRLTVDPRSRAGQDLLGQLAVNADQPAGQLQWGVWHMDRGQLDAGLAACARAVAWDGGSAPLREAYAIALSSHGKMKEALLELKAAVRLAPRHGDLQFKLALALNEAGQRAEALAALEQAVQFDADHPRAWYNLGLARNEAGDSERAIAALLKAETLNPADPMPPYAAATILAQRGQLEEARRAAERALDIEPQFQQARELLRSLR